MRQTEGSCDDRCIFIFSFGHSELCCVEQELRIAIAIWAKVFICRSVLCPSLHSNFSHSIISLIFIWSGVCAMLRRTDVDCS